MPPAPCHPERPHLAKGLCSICYRKAYPPKRTPAQKTAIRKAQDRLKCTPEGRAKVLLGRAKENSHRRGLDFNLELSDIVIPSHCPVLGIPLDCAAKRPSDNLPSLDRIDNTKGYVKGNVWVISWRANFIKVDATHAELRALVVALDRQLEQQAARAFQARSRSWFQRTG